MAKRKAPPRPTSGTRRKKAVPPDRPRAGKASAPRGAATRAGPPARRATRPAAVPKRVTGPTAKAGANPRAVGRRATAASRAPASTPATRQATPKRRPTRPAPPRASAPPAAVRATSPSRRAAPAARLPAVAPGITEPLGLPLDDDEEPLVPGAPSSLVPDRRLGRAVALASPEDEFVAEVAGEGGLRAGDLDVDLQRASSSGDETPGGDNPTPDQDVVDMIGRSLGVEYEDDEELRGAEKIEERDRRRWELDPASAEDFKERKR